MVDSPTVVRDTLRSFLKREEGAFGVDAEQIVGNPPE
jgi:hypothetical protein